MMPEHIKTGRTYEGPNGERRRVTCIFSAYGNPQLHYLDGDAGRFGENFEAVATFASWAKMSVGDHKYRTDDPMLKEKQIQGHYENAPVKSAEDEEFDKMFPETKA